MTAQQAGLVRVVVIDQEGKPLETLEMSGLANTTLAAAIVTIERRKGAKVLPPVIVSGRTIEDRNSSMLIRAGVTIKVCFEPD